jgi:hypothetical protein
MSDKQCNCGICPLVANCFCGDHTKCGLNEYVGRNEELERLAEIGRYTEMVLENYFLEGYQTDRQMHLVSELIEWGREQESEVNE